MLYRFLSGDFPLTIMFLIVLGVFAKRHWSGVLDYWNEKQPFWRIVGRTTWILALVLPIWIAVFDNWRQLLGYTLSAKTRYKSDVFNTAPTPEVLRVITIAMIVISLICVALIYARRQHGLSMLVVTFIFSIAYFYFLNSIRMRADVFLATTRDSLTHPSIVNFAFILFWSIGLYGFICSVIAALYAWMFTILAVPLHVIFSIAMRNRAAVDEDSLDVYRRIRQVQPDSSRRNPDDHEGSPPLDTKRVAH